MMYEYRGNSTKVATPPPEFKVGDMCLARLEGYRKRVVFTLCSTSKGNMWKGVNGDLHSLSEVLDLRHLPEVRKENE